jgi:hypothetical protein
VLRYFEECHDFGYYSDSSLGFPSTTLTDLPTVTAISPSVASTISGCSDCTVVADAIQQCGTHSLDVTPTGSSFALDLPLPDGFTSRYFLGNRTAAECFCTVPVIDSLYACGQCLTRKIPVPDATDVVEFYMEDCAHFGYFPDRNWKSYQSTTHVATHTSTSQGAQPTVPGGTKNEGIVGHPSPLILIGCQAALLGLYWTAL